MLNQESAPAATKPTGATAESIEEPLPTNDTTNDLLAGYPDILTPEQVADILQISAYTVRQMLREGQIRALKTGKLWRIPLGQLRRFIKASLDNGGN